jgi:hypothetical protein
VENVKFNFIINELWQTLNYKKIQSERLKSQFSCVLSSELYFKTRIWVHLGEIFFLFLFYFFSVPQQMLRLIVHKSVKNQFAKSIFTAKK